MEKKKSNKFFTHLTLEDRNIIEEELNQGSNFSKIATILEKDASTISKEVKRNFSAIKPFTFNKNFNEC